uniref:HAT C-terminal dimerisation domain-containing protein n=1 Tax=Oryza sativa subsp. japonica TaxID=39947 RepID=Q60EB0_ORYSJ|nr:hypothetical protein [Oryza sativa Japonica Group]
MACGPAVCSTSVLTPLRHRLLPLVCTARRDPCYRDRIALPAPRPHRPTPRGEPHRPPPPLLAAQLPPTAVGLLVLRRPKGKKEERKREGREGGGRRIETGLACGPLMSGNYNSNNVAALDVGSEYGFDTSYYANRTVRARVRRHAPLAKTLPKLIQLKGNQTQSTSSFANAMVKMGNLRGGYPGELCICFSAFYLIATPVAALFKGLNNIGELSIKLFETKKHDLYDLVYLLLKLVLILPVATASVERVFSAINLVKTKVRNSMSDK